MNRLIDFYENICRKVNSKIGLTEKEIQERREKEKNEFLQNKKRLRNIEREVRQNRILYGEESVEYKRSKKRSKKINKKFIRSKNNFKKNDFKKTVYFIGMELNYEEVYIFSIFSAIITFFLVLTVSLGIHLFRPFTFLEIIAYVVPSLSVFPMLIMLLVANFPDIMEKKMKAESIGKAPQSIHYMTMSMRVTPSLYRAIYFSANNAEEPLSTGLNKIL
ncbi:MAG: hypothetical protein ACOC85_01010, partial [Thermoplasmatota archaeon]